MKVVWRLCHLLYNPIFLYFKLVSKEQWHHVVLELFNGTLYISYNTDTLLSQTGYVGQALNDGQFHKVNLVLQNKKPYQATLTVDSTQSVIVTGTQAVDFQQTNKFYIGGLPTISGHARKNLITGRSFVGCIKVGVFFILHCVNL